MHSPSASSPRDIEAPPSALQEGAHNPPSFGIWQYDARAAEFTLSGTAAELLAVEQQRYANPQDCLVNVAIEDREVVAAALDRHLREGAALGCSFRVSTRAQGLHWLRLSSIPQSAGAPGFASGFVADITPIKLAEMRERFFFKFTQLLIGTHTVDEVIAKILPLVCINLGWDWGAYWTTHTTRKEVLFCRHYWHDPKAGLAAFSTSSLATPIPSGHGLVGKVWRTAQSTWIEDMPGDSTFLRQTAAIESGLYAGYAFPVIHTCADGVQHRLGVLEFFSKLPRQRTAQLPLVSTAVGALIGQTMQRLEHEASIRRMAQVDDMTGLANRSHFHQLVEQACRSAGADATFGLLYIDLDQFKPVNDAFGHEAGNVLLKEFALRLEGLLPQGSVAGRLGGDEFCVLLKTADFAAAAASLSEAILKAARTPVAFNGCPLVVSASIGVSAFPADGASAAELLRNADAAMYRSKNGGRNQVSFSACVPRQTPGLRKSSLVERMTIEAELQQALQREEFFLEYQPIIDCANRETRRTVSVEALIRWRKASGEVVYPDRFIQVAEERGMILDIGRWVVRRACTDLAMMHRAGMPELRVNVNMAAPDFARASLPAELLAATRQAGILPQQLALELTERMMMKQPDKVIPIMRELRRIGFKISLDDFGTEHSSLSRLKNLPLTSLKIDRSFIKGLPGDPQDRAIVRAMLELGREMNLVVVTEGVETEEQLEQLRQLGNPLIQGYLLGRPKPLVETIARLRAERAQEEGVRAA
jgi:diguanylate cyclase (GGDEF)-like protein